MAILDIYCIYWTVWDRYMQVLFLGRAPLTKETLPDFLKWRRVTRHPLVFRGLTGSQWTPGFWGHHTGTKPRKYLEMMFFFPFSIYFHPNQPITQYTHQNHSICILSPLFYSNHLLILLLHQKPIMNYSQNNSNMGHNPYINQT